VAPQVEQNFMDARAHCVSVCRIMAGLHSHRLVAAASS
jgi:hypothetical protein